jgi:two-component system sensor kinase FixL
MHEEANPAAAATARTAGATASAPAGSTQWRAEEEGRLLLQGRIMHVSRLATIGEMAAGVAHEINQPLTAIATYAQACNRLLEMPQPDLAEVKDALREIAAQAVRAGAIIRRLRNLVRVSESVRAPSDINHLVQELAELMQTDARVHDVRLRLELAKDLPQVIVDRVQIQHVLLNLLRNALEALGDRPAGQREVVVRTALTPEGEVEMSVSDSGSGISPTVAERMFDPFFTTKEAGTGLGLTISSTIVRMHKGALGHRPNVPNGVCFYIRLPAA